MEEVIEEDMEVVECERRHASCLCRKLRRVSVKNEVTKIFKLVPVADPSAIISQLSTPASAPSGVDPLVVGPPDVGPPAMAALLAAAPAPSS